MSHYYGSISNGVSKTNVTRRGFKTQGMSAHVRGWDVGVQIEVDHVNGKDVFKVYKTGGSNNPATMELIAEVK